MIHIRVLHTNESYTYYTTNCWRIDARLRMLVIGRGVPRTHVPLDTVLNFELEECHGKTSES